MFFFNNRFLCQVLYKTQGDNIVGIIICYCESAFLLWNIKTYKNFVITSKLIINIILAQTQSQTFKQNPVSFSINLKSNF